MKNKFLSLLKKREKEIVYTSMLIIIFILSFLLMNSKKNELYTSVLNTTSNKENVISLDFSKVKDSSIDANLYSNVWWQENIQLKEGSEMDIFYPKWSFVPSSTPRWWAWFIYKLEKTFDKVRLEYKVKFDGNFNFVKWWKLPWLCWWDCPRWWNDTNNWFSARFMWRTWWDWEVYWYFADKTWEYWKSLWRWTFKFLTNKYYTLSQELTLNTVGKSDWIIVLYLDWKEVYRNKNINFRSNEWLKIDSILFSTFFWWSDTTWATPIDTHAYFKDFKLYYY